MSTATAKHELVYAGLRERILSSELPPGRRLVISSVAKEYGVSAQPVREAIRRLEAEGLVAYTRNAGAMVTPADPEKFEGQIRALALLEGYVTAASIDRLPVDVLRAYADEMLTCTEQMDVVGFVRADQAFHAAIYACCENPLITELLVESRRRMKETRDAVYADMPYRGLAAVHEHIGLVDLLAEGAPASEVERAAEAHGLAAVESFRTWFSSRSNAS